MLESLNELHPWAPAVAGLVLLALVAWLADQLVKRVLIALASRIARRTEATWDDALVESKVLNRLAWLMPALVVHYGIRFVPGLSEEFTRVVGNVVSAWTAFAVAFAVVAALNAVNAIYEQRPESRERPIKGFLQLAQIGVLIVAPSWSCLRSSTARRSCCSVAWAP